MYPNLSVRELKLNLQCIFMHLIFRPSTPVFDLLEHKYQDRWMEQNKLSAELRQRGKLEAQKMSNRCYSETRASRLRRHSPPVDPPPLWQMPKFQKKVIGFRI